MRNCKLSSFGVRSLARLLNLFPGIKATNDEEGLAALSHEMDMHECHTFFAKVEIDLKSESNCGMACIVLVFYEFGPRHASCSTYFSFSSSSLVDSVLNSVDEADQEVLIVAFSICSLSKFFTQCKIS